jgi:flagellar protein FliS
MSFARARYRQADSLAQDGINHPHDVILVTLRELTRSLSVLAAAQEQQRTLPGDHLNRALTALYILQSSLDFDAGGTLATDLFQLYEFARFHVLKAWRGEDGARLQEAALAIGDILQGWQEIGAQVKPPAA